MKKIFYSYHIHGVIEVPNDVTDEEIERLIFSDVDNRYLCDGALVWTEGGIENGCDSRDSTHLVG